MSWKKAGALKDMEKVETSARPDKVIHHATNVKKDMIFNHIETNTLETDVIDSNLLMINSKEMLVNVKRLNIQSNKNSIHIPSNAAININQSVYIDNKSTSIKGTLVTQNEQHSNIFLKKVKRVELEKCTILDNCDYRQSNNFIIECMEREIDGEIILMPYTEMCSRKIDYLYSLTITLNLSSKQSPVEINIQIPDQNIIFELRSHYSSVSLLWLPEGKWVVESIGFKTTLIDNNTSE